ncbi:MAG: AbrB/MazE/SpoVT family DNA-binding domain-containing protein [Candidatus Daviesbacteria bacterium]|nr:AbrB/MazE/SpoVT family DNA-binding domain-containing protein [Candidatus Daviesbacteria bacterium]
MYTVSITSQGQISIPVKLRRLLGLDKYNKAIISENAGKLIVEPVGDILSLGGTFKTKKRLPFRKIHEGFEQYLADEGMKGMR